jgi:hypothetical protein
MIMTKIGALYMLHCWLIAVSLLALNAAAQAQQNTSSTKPKPAVKTLAVTNDAGSPVPGSQPFSMGQATYLVRSTLMTLNDADRSGNYSVLRDLSSPEFQARNSAADLAQSFLDLRRRKFDLFAVSFATPQFSPAPQVDANGRIRLMGFFPTRPLQIRFDLTFQSVDGEWKLLAISVATPQALKERSSASPLPETPPRTTGVFYGVRLFSGTAGWRW